MSFFSSMDKWGKAVDKILEQRHRFTMLGLFGSVITSTPALTGRLRGNWIISNDAPASSILDIEDPGDTIAREKVTQHVMGLPRGDFSVYLTNNLPYAHAVEFDGHSHTKAPEGMVRINFKRVAENLKRNG